MLERLVIRNLAVIEKLDIELNAGLTVLTGETGAGKSIIVDALNLLLGGRATSDLLRSGEDKAFVQGVFTTDDDSAQNALKELGLYEDDALIITREITASRSTCRINSRVVSQTTLREIGAYLVDMHGQHDHQSLLHPDKHLRLVDSYIGEEAREILLEISIFVKRHNACLREIRELSGDERERSRLIDLFMFQVQEIDNARLTEGEEDALRAERSRLINFEKLQGAVDRVYSELYAGQGRGKSVLDMVGRVLTDLTEAARLAPELSNSKELVEQASYLLDDAAREISNFKDELSFEPERLEQLETRLDLVSKLKRKYGEGIAQILAFREEAAATLERISNSKGRVAELEAERSAVHQKFHIAAQKLRTLRQIRGNQLASEAENHIRDLGMKNARLALELKPLSGDNLSALGTEKIELLFSANLGEEPKPLSKIASGGEMSRVMLGLKAVFSQLDNIPTLVFDEIDSGVGGKAAQAVAEKIARVASNKQVLCVTHLPQIAAVAQTHFYIQKHTHGERTVTTVSALEDTTRVRELARMLSGDESQVALQHAQELLNKHHKN